MKIVARLVVIGLALVALRASTASAQVVAADQAKCISAINGSMRKVALAVSKATRDCANRARNGGLAPQTMAQCVSASTKVQKLVAYALLKSDHACNGTPPSFGPESISAHVALAQIAGAGILADLFGATPENALSIDPIIAQCQGTVLKAMEK